MNFQDYFQESSPAVQITDAQFLGIKNIQSSFEGGQGDQKLAVYELTINGNKKLPVYLDGMGIVFIKRLDGQLNYSANLLLDDPFYRAYENPPELDRSKAKEIERMLVGNREVESSVSILLKHEKIELK